MENVNFKLVKKKNAKFNPCMLFTLSKVYHYIDWMINAYDNFGVK